jgi:ribonuclease Z
MKRNRVHVMDTVLRILAALVGLFFLGLGIGFLTLPEVFATGFFVEPARAVGINAIRGDFGAMFLGMGFFCLLGTLTVHRRLLVVPIVFLALVLIGRLTSVIVDDLPVAAADAMWAEAVFLIILISSLFFAPAGTPPAEGGIPLRAFAAPKVLAGIAVVAVIVSGIFVFQKQIGLALVRNIAAQYTARDVFHDLPDGLHVGLCGSGSPMMDSKRAGPCVFVIAGRSLYLVDAGPSSGRKLELMRLQPGNMTAVLLTHFHSDHIGELGELMLKRWAGGAAKDPLPVFGPRGVETVVQGFNLAYSLDSGHRVAHHGPETTPPGGAGGIAKPFDFPDGKDAVVIIDADGVKVTAFLVDHRPVKPAVGYRFDYKGRSAVISGDTLPSETLRRMAAGADLLLHDALQPVMVRALSDINRELGRTNIANITEDILDYHAFPEEAARIAEDAGVQQLLLYHMIPPLPVSVLHKAFLGEAKTYFNGPITIGVDGLMFSMPAGSRNVEKKWIW